MVFPSSFRNSSLIKKLRAHCTAATYSYSSTAAAAAAITINIDSYSDCVYITVHIYFLFSIRLYVVFVFFSSSSFWAVRLLLLVVAVTIGVHPTTCVSQSRVEWFLMLASGVWCCCAPSICFPTFPYFFSHPPSDSIRFCLDDLTKKQKTKKWMSNTTSSLYCLVKLVLLGKEQNQTIELKI
jgi:hypothetical protein